MRQADVRVPIRGGRTIGIKHDHSMIRLADVRAWKVVDLTGRNQVRSLLGLWESLPPGLSDHDKDLCERERNDTPNVFAYFSGKIIREGLERDGGNRKNHMIEARLKGTGGSANSQLARLILKNSFNHSAPEDG